MNWKYVKIGVLAILGLLFLIPTILYLNAIDLSRKHSTEIAALPLYSQGADKGSFRLTANDLEFRIRVNGMQNEGPAIILLHGFPESSLMWQPLIDQAADAGYRVLAFDQRGYSPGARPEDMEDYHIDYLASDVLAVADQVGFETFHLVGHDWGAGIGWKTVMDFPNRVHTWTAMSIPHMGVFYESILNHPEQQKRSAYIQRLQTPFLPEFLFLLGKDDFAKRLEGKWTPAQIDEFLAIQTEYGALTAALNWYRSMNIEEVVASKSFDKRIQRPTLFIWGTEDQVVAPEIIPLQEAFMDTTYKEVSFETGHSLIQMKTDKVIEEILGFIGGDTR